MSDQSTHDLKVWPEFWPWLESGAKPFELRQNDRDFKTGDLLLLREWTHSGGYTGREMRKRVSCVVGGRPWLVDGFVCMGLQDV